MVSEGFGGRLSGLGLCFGWRVSVLELLGCRGFGFDLALRLRDLGVCSPFYVSWDIPQTPIDPQQQVNGNLADYRASCWQAMACGRPAELGKAFDDSGLTLALKNLPF